VAADPPTPHPPRWAIALPQYVADAGFDPEAMRAYVARAEALGFESAWTQENVLGVMPHLSPIETMTYAAACSERLRLGCAVLVSPLHTPVHLAKSLSTLDQLSRGRLEVGIGVGGGFRDFGAFGLDATGLVSRFTEGLALMKACWTEREITFPGRFWQLEGAAMEPKPFQKPHPPVWFGGGHPDAVRRAARLADGFFGAGSATTAQFAEQVQGARAALAERGRDAATFPIAKRVYIEVDDDTERARATIAGQLDRLYGHFGLTGMERVAVYGPPEACARGLQEVADAGAELILLNPMVDHAAQMERLAAEVMPLLPVS
jgi:probable F420-dependent oxidoreductase